MEHACPGAFIRSDCGARTGTGSSPGRSPRTGGSPCACSGARLRPRTAGRITRRPHETRTARDAGLIA